MIHSGATDGGSGDSGHDGFLEAYFVHKNTTTSRLSRAVKTNYTPLGGLGWIAERRPYQGQGHDSNASL